MSAAPDRTPLVGMFTGIGNLITGGDDDFVRMLGYTRGRFDADRAARMPLSPRGWDPIDEAALTRANGDRRTSEAYEKVLLHADGHEVPVLVVFWTDPTDPPHWVGCAVDLTASPSLPAAMFDLPSVEPPAETYEQLLAELVHERHRITSMLDATTDLVWAVDADLRLLGSNAPFVQMMQSGIGWTPVAGDDLMSVGFPEEQRERWAVLYARCLRGEVFSVRESVGGRVFEVRFSPVRDRRARIAGGTMVASDVTAEVETLRSLEQSERLLAIAARLGRVAAWTLDPVTHEVTVSAELLAMFGLPDQTSYPLDEALLFYPESDRDAVSADLRGCAGRGTPVDRRVPLRRSSGRQEWVRLLAEAQLDDDGRVIAVHGAIADITDEVLRTARLREQASLLDNASDAIIVRGLDGTVRYWNRAAEDLFGWTAAEAIGRHIADLVDAGDREKYARIEALLLDEGEWAGRIENTDRDGNPLILDLHLTLVTDETSRPVAAFSIARDVSDQVALEQRLAQSQKLELIGQLAGGVAHDFNNLLTVISGSAELLAEMVAGDPEAASLLEMMLAATARGGDLTGRLLAAARRQPLRPRIVDPVEAVGHAIELLRRSLPEAIEIVVSGPDAPWPISIDPAQLEAAILNLALNARDAMDGRGRITVVIDHMTVAESPDGDIAPGDYVRLSVSDVGRGMDDEVRSRAFDPFFTTKPAGTGSGLGLSMVQGFARQSGGSAEIHSSPGGGTTVVLLFPKAGAAPIDRVGRGGNGDLPRGHERILVVEDDPLVREQTVASLVRLGYQVESVGDADTALVRLDDGDPAIELVFSDVVMPGRLDGADLATEIGRRWPNLPVILTSGYHEQQQRPVPAGITFIPKPYRRRMVARAIRRALDRVAR